MASYLTLPDYLRPDLKLVFIGLNPGLYSAQQGKYFARKTNRFWTAMSASQFAGMKAGPGDEKVLFERGIGFTDVVKRASGQIDELTHREIQAGAQQLRRKLVQYAPTAACFIGITGYRWVFAAPEKMPVRPGPQPVQIGVTRIYVLPSTSPANAHYSLDEIVAEFRRMKSWLKSMAIVF